MLPGCCRLAFQDGQCWATLQQIQDEWIYFCLRLSVSYGCVVLTGLGRKSTEIMATTSKAFSLFHCLSLLAEAALIAEQGFSSRGLTSRAARSWSLIPWFVTLEQQGWGEEGTHIRQLLHWGWQRGLRAQDIDPVLSSIFYWMSAVDISQNLSLDLSLSLTGDDQVLWDIWKAENAKTFWSISLLNIGLDKHLWILLLFR